MSLMKQVGGSSLLKFWKGVGHRAMAMLARYLSDGMMLMIMCAAAVDTIIMIIVAATAAVVVNSAVSADVVVVVVVIPEAVVVVRRLPAMDSSATMLNYSVFRGV